MREIFFCIAGITLIVAGILFVFLRRIFLMRYFVDQSVANEIFSTDVGGKIKFTTRSIGIALCILGLVSLSLPLIFPETQITTYLVKGLVEKEDGVSPRDILIVTRFPPPTPTDEGKLADLKVWKGPDGRFPVLAFSHDKYGVIAVDLNDNEEVDYNGTEIQIKNTVKLVAFKDQ